MPPRSLFVAFLAGALGGCFLGPNIPPTFRYACEVDDDCLVLNCQDDEIQIADAKARGLLEAADLEKGCNSLEAVADPTKYIEYRQKCIGGLCQFPCGLSTFPQDCPEDKGYNFCFNGGCSHICGADAKRVPDPDAACPVTQSCMVFDEEIDLETFAPYLPSGGGNSPAQLIAMLPPGAGVCGRRCDDEGAPPCPAGQYCSGVLCMPDCDHPDATPCLEDEVCFAVGEFSACLGKCDPSDPESCETGQICVAGLDICAPTCVGPGATECGEGFTCDLDLLICVPEGGLTSDGPGTTTDGASDSTGTSG